MIATLIASIVTGFVAGAMHVVTGPDHIAAIAPLAVQGRAKAWISGVRWGLGHASGVLLVGAISLLVRELFSITLSLSAISSRISFFSERLVGVMLICIGFWGLRKAFRLHAHEHQHANEAHVHLHAHAPVIKHPAPQNHVHKHTAFGIGTIHGLAGSSHFLGVMPTLALPLPAAGAYLGFFGLGTIAAMGIFACAMGWISERFTTDRALAYKRLMGGCSLASLLVGAVWVVHPF